MFTRKPLHPSDLGLILSYKCQAECVHCLYNCGPGWADWMAEEEIDAALEAMLVWDQPFQVHITGGEPFLNFPLLLYAVGVAVDLAIPVYVETNAGWCVRDELVMERFTKLKEAGLQAILISCSPFHAETIPPERTLLGIRLALEVLGSRGVIVYLPEWIDQVRSFGIDGPTPIEHYVETFGEEAAGRLFWEGYGLISGGRSAYKLGHLTNRHSPEAYRTNNCRREILYAHHSHMDLYGNFISGFCGGLSEGDWHDLPGLMDDFERGRYPQIINTLIESGPYGLMAFARQAFDYQPNEDGYVGKCHLCVDVRQHLAHKGSFPELEPAEFYKRF
ncbi:MAG: radical SAM protein [Anaerolineales bacterium]|nr:radical SAM protein [Anaerolineales bacterium]